MKSDELGKIATEIKQALPQVKAGSLRFWGQWFGRPHDNIHRMIGCEKERTLLRLRFNEGETLSIWSPRGLTLNDSTFRIANAERVRWEWYSYGEPRIASNLYFEDFTKNGNEVSATTNVDWYEPKLNPMLSEAAVEIL